MADFEIPEEQPMIPDPATEAAAQDLARCDAELAEATAIQATEQAHDSRITGQIETLKTERQAIVTRRAAGDQHPTDGTKLAELAADIEGLGLMAPEANDGLTEARRAVGERKAARQQAVTNLSRAEKSQHVRPSQRSPRRARHADAGSRRTG